jgi:hypothetical protein
MQTSLEVARDCLADGVLLEFGHSREQDLALRSLIRRARVLFIMQIAEWKYRAQLPGFELPEAIAVRSVSSMSDSLNRLTRWRHAGFRAGHADFRTASENASTLPRSAKGPHFATLRKLRGM